MSIRDDAENMGLSEIIALQDDLRRLVRRRFEVERGLLFTDIVASTAYLSHHGAMAGEALMQRHHRLLREALEGSGGRVIHTAGDGSFCVAPDVAAGAQVLVRFHRIVLADNAKVDDAHALRVRTGLHWGAVLEDGDVVAGEAVHTAARIMSTADAAEIHVSRAAQERLPSELRERCAPRQRQRLRGIAEPMDVAFLDWRDPEWFPTIAEVVETGDRVPLPLSGRITLGRLSTSDAGGDAHVMLRHSDPDKTRRMSRRQIAIAITPAGYVVEAVSAARTKVDGEVLAMGDQQLLHLGSEIRLSGVVTLRLRHLTSGEGQMSDATVHQHTML